MSFLLRTNPLARQRLFTTSARPHTALTLESATTTTLLSAASAVPKLGRVAKWYLPTMAFLALSLIYVPSTFYTPAPARRSVTLPAATANIGFGITSALNEVNRKVHTKPEMTQEQRNMVLMDSYGERESLADMERALAGLEERLKVSEQDKRVVLEEAYGRRESIGDLQRAMRIYEVQ